MVDINSDMSPSDEKEINVSSEGAAALSNCFVKSYAVSIGSFVLLILTLISINCLPIG